MTSVVKSKIEYQIAPPDGGWGFIIVLAISIILICTFMPIATFGIIFDPLIEKIGNKEGNTALIIGVYFAVQWGTGLAANILLQKMSYRKVAVIGAMINCLGLFLASFVTNLFQLILCFSIAQAVGYGLMLPAVLTAFNLYFDKRKVVAFNFINVLVISTAALFPSWSRFLTFNFGFCGANLIQSGICLNCIPAAICLQPVKWHTKKQEILSGSTKVELVKHQVLETEQEIEEKVKFLDSDDKRKKSLSSPTIANGITEDVDFAKNISTWKSVVKFLDLKLFTDPVYVNIVLGIALCLSADFTFLSIFPVLLSNADVDTDRATTILTVFYVGDIAGRLLLLTITAFIKIKNRNLLLLGAILLTVFRTAFTLNNSFWWLVICSALMGSLRCLFQSTYPLIFTELYEKRFVTAFSLFMVVSGTVSLLTGFLISVLKSITGSNVIVAHTLSVMNLLCAVPWILEFLYYKIKINK